MSSFGGRERVVILRDCLGSLFRTCRGPVEQGGLVLGTRTSGTTLLYDVRPISGALRTPRSFLPPRWRPSRSGRRDVVGWFHTHPGRSLRLSPDDLQVHRHLFPGGGGLALVLDGDAERAEFYTGLPPRPVEVLQVL